MEWLGLMDELHGYTRWKNEGGNYRVYEMGMNKFRERKVMICMGV